MDARTLSAKLGDLEADALVERLADTLPVTEAKTHCNALGYVKTVALARLLAGTVAEAEAAKLGDKMNNVEVDGHV